MKYFLLPFCLIFTLLFSACTIKQNLEAEKAAIKVAEPWLKLIDDGKYAESWTEAAAFFKKEVNEKIWLQQLTTIRKPLGKNLSRKLVSKKYITKVPEAPKGEYVILQFESAFENKKFAVETVTPMIEKNGDWKVSGYYIK